MAQTTNYNFEMPTIGSDNDNWGQKLNDNWAATDALFAGTTPVAGIDINGGTIDNVVIGNAIAAAGSFTTISASGDITGNVIGDIKATDGTVVLNNGSDGTDATFTGAVTGNATTATTTATPRAFSVSGDLETSASVDFDGSAPVDLDVTISNALWDKIYPVDSIYTTTDGSFDPNNVFNGTWSAYAAGKVLVGLNANDSDFDVMGESDGDKTATASSVISRDGWGQYQGGTAFPEPSTSGRLVTGSGKTESRENLESLGHALAGQTVTSSPFDILQPYVVVKYWRRTA